LRKCPDFFGGGLRFFPGSGAAIRTAEAIAIFSYLAWVGGAKEVELTVIEAESTITLIEALVAKLEV
jgi:hypothetical protein